MLKHSPLIGKTLIGRYEVKEMLGEGNTGQVFRVWDRQTRENKAAKIVDVRKKQIPLEAILRFKSEAQTLQSLRHPNIIQYEDFFETNGLYVLVMEYVEAPTFSEHLKQHSTLPLTTLLPLFQRLVEALVFVHDRGLVHHDLKGSNILFSEGETSVLKLLDFGFSKLLGTSQQMGGTLAYMAPEQTGILRKTIDHRADLYSLGIIIYQALTGQVPFNNQDPALLIHQHIAQAPKKPSKLRPETPALLEEVILKLLHKDPEDRYWTTNGLLNDLSRYRRVVEEYNTLDALFDLGEEDHWDSFPQTNPFIGREEDLEQLQRIFKQTIHANEGQTVFLEGIKGIGKTTLFQEFQNTFHNEIGVTFSLHVHQEAYELPFRLVKELLGQIIGYLKNLSQMEQRELVSGMKELFHHRLELYIELVPELSPWIDSQTLAEFSGKRNWEEEDYEILILDFFRGVVASNLSVVLFIDGFEYVDSKSAQCLIQCFKKLATLPVLSIISYTHEELPPHYQEWIASCKSAPSFYHLPLGPLTEKQYMLLVQKLFSNKLDDAPFLVESFYHVTLGNPSLLRKLLQELIDLKLIYYQERTWHTDLDEVLKVVKNFKLHQDFTPLAHWEERERMILQRGTVFHRAFTWKALQAVSQIEPAIEGVNDEALLKLLDHAVQSGVLYLASGKIYAFRDNQVRQALLNELPQALRQSIHQAIAQHLEEHVFPQKMDAIYDIAFHWEKSGDPISALHYNFKAAQCTDDGMFLNPKSEIYYNLALKWLKRIPADEIEPELQFEVRHNAIRHSLFQNPQTTRLWEETLALENWIAEDQVKRLKLLYLKAFLSFSRNRKDLFFQYGQEALDSSQTAEDGPHIVGLYTMMGKVASNKSYAERTELLMNGIEMAHTHQQYGELPSSLAILMILLAYQGRFQEAELAMSEFAQKLKGVFPKEMLHSTMSIGLETERGNFHEVLKFEKLLEADTPFMTSLAYLFFQWRIALAHGMLGNFKEALQGFDQCLGAKDQKGGFVHRIDIMLARIQLALRMEEPETALFYVDQLSSQPISDPYQEAMLALYEGWIYMNLDQLQEAADCLENKAKPLAEQLKAVLLDTHLEFAQAKLHWLQTKDAQFIEAANQALQKMIEYDIIGYYEIYKEDLNHWAPFISESFSQFSSSSSFVGNNEIAQLMEVNRKITATLELNTLFETILEGAMTIVGAEHGYLFTNDQDYDVSNPKLLPTLRLTRNAQGKLIRPSRYLFSKSVVRTVMQTKTAVITRDARHEKRWNVHQSITDQDLRSILAIPMIRQDEITGILYLDNHQASSVFSFKDKEIVEMFATQANIALNNAQAYEREQAARQQVEATLKIFEHFVPRRFTDRFAGGNIEQLTSGLSQEETLSILFSDIRGFTTLSEEMSHNEIFKFLNAYLRRMEAPIRKNGGFVDKFIGDAIMALFDQSPQDAVLAGLDMLAVLEEYNQQRLQKGKTPVHIGIGINTGEVMLGVIGSQERIDTTVLGDTVNIASRVEELTKSYGTPFLISGATYAHVSDMEGLLVRLIDEVQVKGKAETTQVYEVYNNEPEWIRDKKQSFQASFQEAFQYYQAGHWIQCEQLFEDYLKQFPEDRAAFRFIKRSRIFMKMPPTNWNGVYQIENSK